MNSKSSNGISSSNSNSYLSSNKQDYFGIVIGLEMLAAVVLRVFVFQQYDNLFINDAYIFMRYAENMANGNGLVYNLGERVLGYSSPLYVLLLSGLKFIFAGLPFNIVISVFNLFLFVFCGFLFSLLIKNRGISGLIFFTIFCFYFSYVDAAVDGMGTMLMLAVILSALYAVEKDKIEMALILGFLSLLVRPEGSLFIASLMIMLFLLKRRFPSLTTIIICILILLIWLVPTYLYFGNILPDSILAKSTLFADKQWGGIQSGFFEKTIMLMFGLSDNTYFSFGNNLKIVLGLIALIASIVFIIGVIKESKNSGTIFTAAVFFVLSLIFYYVGSPVRMFSWYTIVPSIIFMFVIISSSDYLFQKIRYLWPKVVIWGMVLLICIISIFLGLPERKTGILTEVNKDKEFLNYLEKTASGIKSIMISDIGYIGYWKQWRIIDGSGLVSPQVLEHKKDKRLSFLSDIFKKEKPDVIYFKVNILNSRIVDENMRYGTFRNITERKDFLDNYKEVSKAEEFAEIFVRKSLLNNPDPTMLK